MGTERRRHGSTGHCSSPYDCEIARYKSVQGLSSPCLFEPRMYASLSCHLHLHCIDRVSLEESDLRDSIVKRHITRS